MFDAFNNMDSPGFKHTLLLVASLVAADVSISLAGRACLELFSRNAMREVFRRFFQHLIYQVFSFPFRFTEIQLHSWSKYRAVF